MKEIIELNKDQARRFLLMKQGLFGDHIFHKKERKGEPIALKPH